MPRRDDIKSILIIGAGPIVISQACEFDYSGSQACKVLREEGYRIILVNSNPATIMTDPDMADRTYIEPIEPETVSEIIEKERPDAVLPTLGGQTALNTAMKLYEAGVFDRFGVKMLGADYDVVKKAEDRQSFKDAMLKIGLDVPRSFTGRSVTEILGRICDMKFPLIVRPSFTLGGTGGGIARDKDELESIVSSGLNLSMTGEVLIEESVLGWKEYELEVMRDEKDNAVIVCSIENIDPMGVHTGDSITVAPQQTLSDREYQEMRTAAIMVMREIGVRTGGSNVQFAVDPVGGRMVVIEMNPRVSRSSALASKATGFPIAKFAAKLAVGYTLDEVSNDITGTTPACFEPALDYCVVKIPRFAFEKFNPEDSALGISMKSVGETMAIGTTFREALQKGLRGLETGKAGLESAPGGPVDASALDGFLAKANPERICYVKEAFLRGYAVEKISALSGIDPWFLVQIKDMTEFEKKISAELFAGGVGAPVDKDFLLEAKKQGFSDRQLARLCGRGEADFRELRKRAGVLPSYKIVDTCAAEFESRTPYYYSSYDDECEAVRSGRKKIMILGGGPNRIGQGIEFDYCCCHASFALKKMGFETIMVNSNPETVSTDYDTSDKLYFEPVTMEDVLNIFDKEKPEGVIVQFGGQTPLNLAKGLAAEGVPIIGTSIESIELAENREKFSRLIRELGLRQPDNRAAASFEQARDAAREIGYPVMLRPSYVLGGGFMKIAYDGEALKDFMAGAEGVSEDSPVLIDKFLEDAIEVDVDAVSDGETVIVPGIMEHIEEAGIHSGDSACVFPPHTLGDDVIDGIRRITSLLAEALKVSGLLNIQFAVKDEKIFVLEVNPRASRTVPFVSKATGLPLAGIAAKIMAGEKLADMEVSDAFPAGYVAVKESVLPFARFAGVDIILGPEMKSTGEVMGISGAFGPAFYKAQLAAGTPLPKKGGVFLSVKDGDKRGIVFIAKKLSDMGFGVFATAGTAKILKSYNIDLEVVPKVFQGSGVILEKIKKREISLVINTPSGERGQSDMKLIRRAALENGISCVTTLQGAQAAVNGIESVLSGDFYVKPLQEYLRQKV